MGLTLEGKLYLGAIGLLSVLSYVLLGVTGMRTIVGFALLMVLPFYFIFSLFKCSELEKIAFSFFTGITVVPSLVYWLGFVMSFRVAILIVFLLLIGTAFALHKALGEKTNLAENSKL
jgi:hypothetical protein